MNKNQIISIIVIVFVLVAGWYFLARDKTFEDVVFEKDKMEVESLSDSIEMFSNEEVILDEIDQTFEDISNGAEAISVDDVLSETSISQEADQADFSDILDAFSADSDVFQELDQVFGEVLQ